MRTLIAILVVGALHAASSSVQACGREHISGTRTVSVSELAKAIALESNVVVLDVSKKASRRRLGVIPGATVFAKTLPTNKNAPVVFYCEDERCHAASKAAKRATDAGYTNVRVLEGGLRAWKSAGHTLAKAR